MSPSGRDSVLDDDLNAPILLALSGRDDSSINGSFLLRGSRVGALAYLQSCAYLVRYRT
jgi:hypothetical protein